MNELSLAAAAPSPDALHHSPGLLSRDAVRRLMLSLIEVAQSDLIKKGAVSPELALSRLIFGLGEDEIEGLAIDESSLGFDSLSRLDLVLSLNQFFQLHMTGVEDYLLVKRGIGDWVDLVLHHCALMTEKLTISFQTSGSTSTPKRVTHTLVALQREITALQQKVLGRCDKNARIIALVPPRHIYGFLFTCLLPSQLSLAVVDLHRHPPSSVFSKSRSGDIIVATPFVWHHLARAGQRFASDIHGITSSAPSSAETWSAKEKTGLATLTEIYGATETGGVGYRCALEQDFALLPHLKRDGERVLHAGAKTRELDLQDHLTWTEMDGFRVTTRKDAMVQVAGINVSQNLVVRTIEEVDGVRSAHVRLDGERLKALVIPANTDQDTKAIGDHIRNHLRATLAPAARPAEITFRTSLPRDEMGKVTDWS